MYQQIHGLMEQRVPLHPAQIERLHAGAESCLVLRAELLKVVARRTWLADAVPKLRWQPEAGMRLPPTPHPTSGLLRQQPSVDQMLVLTDPAGQAPLVQLKLSLVAALVLYDNYLAGIYPYCNDKHICPLVNRDDPATAGKLQKITEPYVRLDNHRRLARSAAADYARGSVMAGAADRRDCLMPCNC